MMCSAICMYILVYCVSTELDYKRISYRQLPSCNVDTYDIYAIIVELLIN